MENALTMLRHEESENNAPPARLDAGVPADQVRVTAEEFARAVARHQARREEAAQKLEGTVSLGDAVQELNVDITPEELLAEVQAARAEQAARAAVAQTRRRPRTGLFLASAGLLAALTIGIYGARTAPAPDAQATVVTAPQSPPAVSIAVPGALLVQDTRGAMPVLRTLQEMEDGVPVRCSLTQTDGHATLADFSNPNSAWTLVKHDGQVYVRGWIPNMSPQAMQISGVTLYNTQTLVPSGAAPRRVSLPLDGIQVVPGQGDDEMIVARKVQTDAHFGDTW